MRACLCGTGVRGLVRGATRLSGSLLRSAAIFSGSNWLLGRETVFLTGLRRGLALALALGFDLALATLRLTGFGFGFGLALAFFTGFGLGFAFAAFFLGFGFGLAFAVFTGFLVRGFFLTLFFLTGTATLLFLAVFLPALILVNCEGVMISTGRVVLVTGLELSEVAK